MVESGQAAASRKGTIWERRGPAFRIWLRFAVAISALMFATILARPFTDGTLVQWIATASAAMLRLMGVEATATGATVRSTIGSMEVIRECTAVYPLAIYLAAVLAYPATWKRKAIGVVGGVLAIQLVNIVRLLTLLYIGSHRPAWFETAHLVVWQSLIVLFTIVFWMLWVSEIADRK